MTDRAWQIIQLVARWLPDRTLVFVADSSFAALTLLKLVSGLPTVSLITRLRLDAALYDPAPRRDPHQQGRPRLKGQRRPTLEQVLANPETEWRKLKIDDWYGEGKRTVEICTETAVWYHSGKDPVEIRWVLIRDPLGEFDPQALLSTKLSHTPRQILTWFIRRWRLEVTFEEARAHVGIETQRQWNDLAIARTTPVLFGLFSLVTLMAHVLIKKETAAVRQAVWYTKEHPTFSDAIAIVRRCLWPILGIIGLRINKNQESRLRMRLQRIPQRVSNCLSPFSSHFNCPQGQHFRVWCWLLVTLLLIDGSAKLKNLTRLMPASLRYWTVRRMVNAGYWDASAALDELVVATFFALPPPADGTLYLIGDKTIKQKSGKKQPLAHKTRMNEFARYVFGQELVPLIAQWGRLRIPVSCEMLDPKRKGHQNILFRQMLRRFRPPAWCRSVVVVADAGFASKPNLRLIQRLEWRFVFTFARAWKLEDGTHLRDLATYLPKS